MDFFRETGRSAQCVKPEMFHVWRESFDMYVTDVVEFSESLIMFDVFVLDASDTSYVWSGEQRSQAEVKLAKFFAERRKSSGTVTSRRPALWTGSLEPSRR